MSRTIVITISDTDLYGEGFGTDTYRVHAHKVTHGWVLSDLPFGLEEKRVTDGWVQARR